MQVLNSQEIDSVSGAVSSDTVYSVAVGAAVGLLAIAIMPVGGVIAGAAAIGSVFSSGVGIYAAW